ncbi:hypothetical protein ElyMa_001619400 [Elysia marginata]|uniref:Neurotransmitter-gated ion-channel transmembrane domain-containing protein n=1 Tax=Elysia marginata TaxID=1093978 RepID=A0AAV4JIS6_9GAST|nr:hypothetical protein ElyMa_001619400 [Elysia marginata]
MSSGIFTPILYRKIYVIWDMKGLMKHQVNSTQKVTFYKLDVGFLSVQSDRTNTNTDCSQHAKTSDLCSDGLSADHTDTALTWQEVAKTLDTFLFMIMSIISAVSTFTAFLILFVGSEINKPQLEFKPQADSNNP